MAFFILSTNILAMENKRTREETEEEEEEASDRPSKKAKNTDTCAAVQILNLEDKENQEYLEKVYCRNLIN